MSAFLGELIGTMILIVFGGGVVGVLYLKNQKLKIQAGLLLRWDGVLP